MSTLDSPAVAALLTQLFAQADRDDPATFQRVNAALKQLGTRRTSANGPS